MYIRSRRRKFRRAMVIHNFRFQLHCRRAMRHCKIPRLIGSRYRNDYHPIRFKVLALFVRKERGTYQKPY
jgi:hypothetical protein